MSLYTVLVKNKNTYDVFECDFFLTAQMRITEAYSQNKTAKVYLYTQNTQTWLRYRPRKPYDGGFRTHLRDVAPEFLPPEAAFIQI